MTKMYLIEDDTPGNIKKIATEQGLIEYANQAYFVQEGQCEKAKDVRDAIEILRTDRFTVTEIENIYDLGD